MKNLRMKLARMEKDLSQIELANRIGVTRQTIGMIEAGDYNPSLKLCIAIGRELDKTLDDLFGEEEEKWEKMDWMRDKSRLQPRLGRWGFM